MAYFGKGTEEAILAYLGVVMNQITGIKFVDYQRVYDSAIGPDRYPGVFINHVRVDKTYHLKNIVKNEFTVAIVGWVWASDAESLGTKLNAFIDSVATKVRTDPTCGNKAYGMEIRSVTTDGGNKHPQGQFVMILDIVFYSTR